MFNRDRISIQYETFATLDAVSQKFIDCVEKAPIDHPIIIKAFNRLLAESKEEHPPEMKNLFTFNVDESFTEERICLIEEQIFNYLLKVRNHEYIPVSTPKGKLPYVSISNLLYSSPYTRQISIQQDLFGESNISHEIKHALALIKASQSEFGISISPTISMTIAWVNSPFLKNESLLNIGGVDISTIIPKEIEKDGVCILSNNAQIDAYLAPNRPSIADFEDAQKLWLKENNTTIEDRSIWHPDFIKSLGVKSVYFEIIKEKWVWNAYKFNNYIFQEFTRISGIQFSDTDKKLYIGIFEN